MEYTAQHCIGVAALISPGLPISSLGRDGWANRNVRVGFCPVFGLAAW